MTGNIPFSKYQGTGNDFVIIDQRAHKYLDNSDTETIKHLCDRRFGIGADGLILLQNRADFDFEMVYFNADGRESTMCGNGGRCITAFAKQVGCIDSKATFMAIDGVHESEVLKNGEVRLRMSDVGTIEQGNDFFVLDTGSPHYVVFVEDISDMNIVESGQVIRYSERFKDQGINVDFVEQRENGIEVATYERGVEDETLSCGTGVTAAAIAWHLKNKHAGIAQVPVSTKGGNLSVQLENAGIGYTNIWLNGPATLVFNGETVKQASV